MNACALRYLECLSAEEYSSLCGEMALFLHSSLREMSISSHLSYTNKDTYRTSRGPHSNDKDPHGHITKRQAAEPLCFPTLPQSRPPDHLLCAQMLFHTRDKSSRPGCDGARQEL